MKDFHLFFKQIFTLTTKLTDEEWRIGPAVEIWNIEPLDHIVIFCPGITWKENIIIRHM